MFIKELPTNLLAKKMENAFCDNIINFVNYNLKMTDISMQNTYIIHNSVIIFRETYN